MFKKKKDENKDRDDSDRAEPWEDNTPFHRRSVFDRDPFFDDMFKDFGAFRGIEEMMNELMKNAMSGNMKMEEGKPFVYGFSMKTGPDGKPIINEFGNIKSGGNVKTGSKPVISDAREPLVDVIERDQDLVIVAELPGVSKNDIDLEVSGKNLEIKVDTPNKKYYKSVELPCGVKEDATDATYNNGVLEVKLKRVECKTPKGRKITIK